MMAAAAASPSASSAYSSGSWVEPRGSHSQVSSSLDHSELGATAEVDDALLSSSHSKLYTVLNHVDIVDLVGHNSELGDGLNHMVALQHQVSLLFGVIGGYM